MAGLRGQRLPPAVESMPDQVPEGTPERWATYLNSLPMGIMKRIMLLVEIYDGHDARCAKAVGWTAPTLRKYLQHEIVKSMIHACGCGFVSMDDDEIDMDLAKSLVKDRYTRQLEAAKMVADKKLSARDRKGALELLMKSNMDLGERKEHTATNAFAKAMQMIGVEASPGSDDVDW